MGSRPVLLPPLGKSALCRHFHLPLQSGSARTLQRMAGIPRRKPISCWSSRRVVWCLKLPSPRFDRWLSRRKRNGLTKAGICRKYGFSGGHVLPTRCVRVLLPPVWEISWTERSRGLEMLPCAVLMLLHIATGKRGLDEKCRCYGKVATDTVLKDGVYTSLSGNYIKVETLSMKPLWNQISRVQLSERTPTGMAGEIVAGDHESHKNNAYSHLLR